MRKQMKYILLYLLTIQTIFDLVTHRILLYKKPILQVYCWVIINFKDWYICDYFDKINIDSV